MVRSKNPATEPLSRRQLLAQGTAFSVAIALPGRSAAQQPAAEISEADLIAASALSGERLSPQRVRELKPMLESRLQQLQALRQFDPDEGEPLPMVRL